MKKWLIPIIGLTLFLAANAGIGFALASNGANSPEVGDPSGDQPPIRSDEGIDPDECNWVHNITACDDALPGPAETDGMPEPGFAVGEPYPTPTADKSCGPMAAIAITSDGEVSCLNLAPDNGDSQDMVSSASLPVAEPVQ